MYSPHFRFNGRFSYPIHCVQQLALYGLMSWVVMWSREGRIRRARALQQWNFVLLFSFFLKSALTRYYYFSPWAVLRFRWRRSCLPAWEEDCLRLGRLGNVEHFLMLFYLKSCYGNNTVCEWYCVADKHPHTHQHRFSAFHLWWHHRITTLCYSFIFLKENNDNMKNK